MKFLIVLALVATAYAAPQYLLSEGTHIEGAKSISTGPEGVVHHDSGSISVMKPEGKIALPVVKTIVDPVVSTRITTLDPLVKPLIDPVPVVSTRITSFDTVKPLVDHIPVFSTRISSMPWMTAFDHPLNGGWDSLLWK